MSEIITGQGYEWDDEKFKSMSSRYSNWYRAKFGYRDVIRIADKSFPIWVHNYTVGVRFMSIICTERNKGDKCPACEMQHKLQDHRRALMFATSVLHLYRQHTEGPPKFIGKLLAWRFGDDKKIQLLEENELSGGNLTKINLSVKILVGDDKDSATAEKFQKLRIQKYDQSIKVNKEQIAKELSAENKAAIRKLYLPSYEDSAKWLKKEDEETSFEPEAFGGGKEELSADDFEDKPEEGKPAFVKGSIAANSIYRPADEEDDEKPNKKKAKKAKGDITSEETNPFENFE